METTNIRLSEVLKRNKSFKRTLLEQEFHKEITEAELDIEILAQDSLDKLVFRDYLDDKLKRRAQTISVAYNIATKLLLSLYLTGTTETYWKTTEVMKDNREKVDSHFEQEDFLTKIVKDTIDNAIGEVDLLDRRYKTNYNITKVEEQKFLLDLANISVTLAWVEAYYKTGFFPKDIQVMVYSNDTHQDLVQEVYTILNRTLDTLKDNLSNLRPNKITSVEFDKEIINEDIGFAGTANIIINKDTLLEIKTTGKSPTAEAVREEFNHAVGINVLDNNIKNLIIYYTRFDYFLTAKVVDTNE